MKFEYYQDEEGNAYEITTDLEQLIIQDLYKAMKRNNEKADEIERLNNKLEELYNDIVERLSKGDFLQINGKPINLKELNDYINSQQQEIERLNNIINELEKWLVESIEKHTEDYLDWKYDRNVYLAGSEKLQNVFDKLQELKVGDK